MPLVSTPPALIRRSALEAAACLYNYQQRYVLGVPDKSPAAMRGIAFHAAAFGPLGYVPRLAKAGLVSDHELAAQAFREALPAEQIPAHLLPEIEEIFQPWVERFELDVDAYLLAEQQQQTAGFTWRPDVVYARARGGVSELEIVDAKTYWAMFTDAQARREFQGLFYVWCARQIWPGFGQYRFTYDFVRFGKQVSVVFTPEELALAERQVFLLASTIKQAEATNQWPATPGPHCQYCTLKCPVLDDVQNMALLPQRVESEAHAQSIASLRLVLTQAGKWADELLRSWVEREGPLEVNGIEFASRAVESVSFPVMPVVTTLQAAGIVPDFTVSKTAIKPYLTAKKYALVREDLLAVAKPKTTYRFGPKKVGTFAELSSGEADES